MKTFNEYITEGKMWNYTHESVVENIKDACGRKFKFIESTRHNNNLRFLIRSVDGNVTVTYDNSKMFGNKENFTINVFSQNLTYKELKDFVSLVSSAQMLVDILQGLERAGQLQALENARG